MKTLNITNGTSTLDLMQAAGIEGEAFSWDDVLHEGPVPSGLSLEALSKVRAEYIASQGWAEQKETIKRFQIRDAKLSSYHQYDEVVLWFEHDLYDQLQLIQVLDWFSSQDLSRVKLSLINPDKYLGHHTPNEFSRLVALKKDVSAEQLTVACQAWQAFTSNSPSLINELINHDLSKLPFLKPALIRLLEEYPGLESGIPKTEQLILACLEEFGRPMKLGELFRSYCHKEEAEFLGDSVFFERLNQMAFCQNPLIKLSDKEKIGFPLNNDLTIQMIGEFESSDLWFFSSNLRKYIGGVDISSLNKLVWDGRKVRPM